MKIVTLLFIITTFSYCKQRSDNSLSNSSREVSLKRYISYVDSLARNTENGNKPDTNEYNYRLLKAYIANDETFLNDVVKHLGAGSNFNRTIDSFYKKYVPGLNGIDAQEAYRFAYSATFCDFDHIITISKKADYIKIHALIFRHIYANDGGPSLQIIMDSSKQVAVTNWKTVEEALYFSDYWGLSSKTNEIVYDPNFLSVNGMKRPVNKTEKIKTHYVERTVFEHTALYKAFLLVMDIAGIKNKCKR